MTKHGYGRTGKRPGPVTTDPAAPAPQLPFVTGATPIIGSTDRAITVNAVVTFGRAMLASSITASTFTLTGPSGVVAAAAVTYDAVTQQATLNPTGDLANGATYTARVKGGSGGVIDSTGSLMAADYVWTFTTIAAVQAAFVLVGYGRTTTGGAGGQVYSASTWAQFRTALEATGPRIAKLTGSAVLDGANADFRVNNPDLTIDGSAFTGILRNYKILFRADNILVTQMAMRTGEGATPTDSTDRRAISFNPPSGGSIRRVALDHCSFAWGPDVIASLLNNSADVTYQHCIFGPALYASNIPTSPNGYGPNITDTVGSTGLTARVTYYRCLMILNNYRNFRSFSTDGFDVVNCVCYDSGDGAGSGNPIGANLVGNIIKRGPESKNDRGWASELGGANSQTYNLNSVYFPVTGADRNIGYTAAGALFTPTATFGAGTQRTTPYDGGPGAASHGGLTVVTPSAALFEEVVANAGRTYQDPLDVLIKNYARNGTSNGYYNGASTGIPPYPTYAV